MSKRNKKDVKVKSASLDITRGDTSTSKADQSSTPALSLDSAADRRETARISKTATVEQLQSNQEDLDLDRLLGQVNEMLTEMTQSKWLSSDWPSLEIDFGNEKR